LVKPRQKFFRKNQLQNNSSSLNFVRENEQPKKITTYRDKSGYFHFLFSKADFFYIG